MTNQNVLQKRGITKEKKKAKPKREGKERLHILPHRPNLIRRMHHDTFLVRLDLELFLINNMFHTRRIISTNIMTGYQRFILRPSALQHLDEIWQMTRCIAAPSS